MKAKERFKVIWSLLFSSKLIDDLQQKLDYSELQRIEEERRFRSKLFERMDKKDKDDYLYVHPDQKVDPYETTFELPTNLSQNDCHHSRAAFIEKHYRLEQIRSSLLFCDEIEKGTEIALSNLTKLLREEGYFDIQTTRRGPDSVSINVSLRMYKRV